MWMILQQDQPDDFVVATGESHSVREFCELAFGEEGMEIEWQGKGIKGVGVLAGFKKKSSLADSDSFRHTVGSILIRIDPRYFRPTEVDFLLGDASKARRVLGWTPRNTFDELVRIMVRADVEALLNLQRSQDVIRQIINKS